MTKTELITHIKKLRTLQVKITKQEAEAEAIKDTIKKYMGKKEEVQAGEYRILYKSTIRTNIDAEALKTKKPDIFKKFSTETQVRTLRIF
ncbi:hypothetical protein SDC9_74041 [bioreactor metagenome]|uniref:Uncharacterized protein n=1 Tax=bioreactor metagenome TaxID=1076179 RepID=A0A644YGS5_9ZZZZ